MIQSAKLQNPGRQTTMAITVQPVTPDFAAEIGDADLSAPLSSSDAADIKDAFTKYAVLIFPDQHLSADQHLDFAQLFGPLETTIQRCARTKNSACGRNSPTSPTSIP
jgi:alpha-ketoglutarate-dependent taurine dioxygenase